MDGLEVLDTLKKINPWFKDNRVPTKQLEPFKRREFLFLEKTLESTEMATLVVGGRRVGKSVLMYQLIDSLLKKGVEGKRILFVQGDNPIFPELVKDGKVLSYILDVYQKHIIEQSFSELREKIYIFIDEAHALPGWQIEVKTSIDLKYNIKFVVTGSSSFKLRRGSQNPLTGRVNIQVISPFSFADYTKYQIKPEEQVKFEKTLLRLSESFQENFFIGNIKGCRDAARLALPFAQKYQVKKKLDEYLFTGGFPVVISNAKRLDISKYLRDLLTTTISKDILSQVDAREPQAFERLMVNLCLSVGSSVKFKTLAEMLGIDERTVAKYVDYYADSHWAFISSPYVFHRKADFVKSFKKIYIIDSGIINTLSFKDESDFMNDHQYKGKVLENVVHNHLLVLKQNELGVFQGSIPFWLDESTRREIDFIFEVKKGILPIEVKYKTLPDKSDLIPLNSFLKNKLSARFGIITTEDEIKIVGKILFIPYSIFLLLL